MKFTCSYAQFNFTIIDQLYPLLFKPVCRNSSLNLQRFCVMAHFYHHGHLS